MSEVVVRQTRPEDFPGIRKLTLEVYPNAPSWSEKALASHLEVFPAGQLVAVLDHEVVGMAASLIVTWDEYEIEQSWRDFTDGGFFTNHDPTGRTLYGAEVMVRPSMQGHGIGGKLYAARFELCRHLGLLRIRAGARLRGYHAYADRMGPVGYVRKVIRGELNDATLSFQLRHGFTVIAVVGGYLKNDPESLGHAAIIEWLNPEVATPEDFARSQGRFRV